MNRYIDFLAMISLCLLPISNLRIIESIINSIDKPRMSDKIQDQAQQESQNLQARINSQELQPQSQNQQSYIVPSQQPNIAPQIHQQNNHEQNQTNSQPQQIINPSSEIQPEKNQQQYHKYDNIMQQNIQYGQYNNNNIDIDEEQNPISSYASRMSKLQQKQQILKYSISDHQEAVKQLFMNLYNQKKKLLELITQEYNRKQLDIDISLYEQFQEMKKTVQKQEKKIEKLKSQIQDQSISTINLVKSSNNSNQRNVILLRQKREQIQNQIQSGSRFAASQYVRDYLQRTYIHKVSYEDVKYQYEMKTKLRENLKIEKEQYDKKKEELKKSIQRQGMLKRQLEEELSRLEAAFLAKAVK